MKERYNRKRVLVTGGLGMIGSSLAIELVRMGAEVTIVDAMLPLYGGNLFNIKDIREQVDIRIIDIRDQARMAEVIKNQDFIFNLAAQVSYVDSLEDPLLDLDINCRGHLIVLELCRKMNPGAVIIFTGSRMEYGKIQSIPVSEQHPLNPLSPYAIHKFAGERYHLMFHELYGLKTIAFRIPNPYGPRQQMKHNKYGILNWFIRLAMENKSIRIFGDGKQFRDYIYIDDIVGALLQAAVTERAYGQVFNLGSGSRTRFFEMAEKVLEVVRRGGIEKVPWPENYFNIETGDYIADISKICSYVDWFPKVEILEGIQMTFQYYSRYKAHYW